MAIVAIKQSPRTYGDYTADMAAGTKSRADVRDRAAYVFVTGQFPSHLRSNYMGILRAVTASFAKPVALDGRSGSMKLTPEAVTDLDLENHPLVKAVRAKLAEGFLIQPSRGLQARRPFGKVFMYRPTNAGNDLVVVNSEGALKTGWD
jgi:hypothetical protein